MFAYNDNFFSLWHRAAASSPFVRWGEGLSITQTIVRGLKTHSGTKKRFKKLPSGKFKRDKIGRVHLNTGTSGAEIRRGRRSHYANLTQEKCLAKLMPF